MGVGQSRQHVFAMTISARSAAGVAGTCGRRADAAAETQRHFSDHGRAGLRSMRFRRAEQPRFPGHFGRPVLLQLRSENMTPDLI